MLRHPPVFQKSFFASEAVFWSDLSQYLCCHHDRSDAFSVYSINLPIILIILSWYPSVLLWFVSPFSCFLIISWWFSGFVIIFFCPNVPILFYHSFTLILFFTDTLKRGYITFSFPAVACSSSYSYYSLHCSSFYVLYRYRYTGSGASLLSSLYA